ncbi:MAG: hypothetical protein U0M06_02015 [Clostridia bacterium]|nr:hypothetical protein [Clostridia bacterium]
MKKRIKIGKGILLIVAFIVLGGYRFINTDTMIPWILAVTSHEIGHLISAKLLGAGISGMTIDTLGARISLERTLISYKDEAIIAFGGPAMNFITAAFLFRVFPNFSAFSLVLGTLNMFPIISLDGYRILYSLTALKLGDRVAGKISGTASFFFLIFLWLIGVYMMLVYHSGISLFLIAFSFIYLSAQNRA